MWPTACLSVTTNIQQDEKNEIKSSTIINPTRSLEVNQFIAQSTIMTAQSSHTESVLTFGIFSIRLWLFVLILSTQRQPVFELCSLFRNSELKLIFFK